MKNRKNESRPSQMVRETARDLIVGLTAGTVAGGATFGVGLLIGPAATVGLICGLGLVAALVLFRDWLAA